MSSDIYKDLNPEQLEAVKSIDGPLLVIAGPGTGKTQLLSSRVAHILMSTDTNASGILCLTFTNKAALNMRQRLMDITDGKARDVVVKTFHSFSSEIMNMYPDYFWNGAQLSTAPDAVQIDIIQNILSSLPLDNPLALKFLDSYTLINDVKNGLKLTKEAGLTPKKLEALIQVNLAYINSIESALVAATEPRLSKNTLDEFAENIYAIPDQPIDQLIEPLVSLSTSLKESLKHAVKQDKAAGKTSNTSAWKQQWVQSINKIKGMHKEKARNNWWLALAGVYEKYRDELHRRGFYDYSDMLVEVLQQIESNPELRADLQERFLYIMIDEFQDTNAAQLRLAHLISSTDANTDAPNLMAVGDDDQSIFKFNGAELNNMLSFKRSYPTCKQVVLTKNYRSSQQILDLASTVIQEADDRLVNRDGTINKTLTAANKSIPVGTIDHTSYTTRDEQLSMVANNIKKSYSHDQTTAVIARGHDSLIQVASLLNASNIPVRYEQQRNVLDHEIVKHAVFIAKIATSINQGLKDESNFSIAKTLQHKMWGIDSRTLWELAILNNRNSFWLDNLLDHQDSNLKAIGNFFLELSRIASSENLVVAIEYIIGLRQMENFIASPIKQHFSALEDITDDYLHGLSAMHLLRNMAAEFSQQNQATLADFVNFIEVEKSNGINISDESPFVSGDNAVSLLTVHKAKGLEFDDVYIIDCIEDNWQPRKNGRKPPANLPLQPTGDTLDDYARLMFVAVTRAKSTLHVTSYRVTDSGKEVLPSPLISNALPSIENTEKVSLVKVLEDSLTWPRLSAQEELNFLEPRLESYNLSVTHLINFLDLSNCGPQAFLERNILRLPETKSSSMAHGTAMHAALERAQKLVNNNAFDLSIVKEAYVTAIKREFLPTTETERYLNHGQMLLEKLFNENLLNLTPDGLPEQNINEVILNKARLGGKLDLINVKTDQIIVSDYKTGAPLSSFSTKNATLETKAWKQRLQLTYYAILLENSSRFQTQNKEVIGQMIYLDAETAKDMHRQYTPSTEEIDRTKRLISAVWNKIMNVDLPNIDNYSKDYSGIVSFEEDLINGQI